MKEGSSNPFSFSKEKITDIRVSILFLIRIREAIIEGHRKAKTQWLN